VERLLANGESVAVIDDFSTGSSANLKPSENDIEIVVGDINDSNALGKAISGVSHVVHLAAAVSVQGSVDDPFNNHKINSTGTLNVLHHASLAGVHRVVFASSSAVYGDLTAGAIDESAPLSPLSPYGASKINGESYCASYARSFDLETAVLRFFNVYGPRQAPDSDYAAVIPKFVSLMTDGKAPTIFGDGLQTRDFIFVGDLARGIISALKADGAQDGPSNMGSGTSVNLLNLVDQINLRLATNISPTHVYARPADVKHSSAKVERASSWGFEAQTSLDDGLGETIGYLKSR